MTSRERVLTALRRSGPDRVPAALYGEIVGYTPSVADLLAAHCGERTALDHFGFDITSFTIDPTRESTDFSVYLPPDEHTVVDEWGVGWKGGSHLHYAEILHPLQSLTSRRIADYPFPDLDREYRYATAAARIADIHDQGRAAAYFAGSIYETAWYMRSMEQLLLDIMTDRATADLLLDRITDIVSAAAAHLAAADLDLLVLGDDIAMQSGMMMSIPMWREVFKPRLERVIQAAREAKPDILVFYHSDGNVWDAIPGLIEVGVDVLNPVQPECMDPAEVKTTFGDRLSFFGTVSVQQTMPFGSPEDVRSEIRERIRTVGHGGGLLLSPSHVLQPDTPWENIVAFFEAVEEYGRY